MLRRRCIIPVLLCCLLFAGCSSKYYRQSADKEVYSIISAKQKKAIGASDPFSIEPYSGDPLKGVQQKSQPLVKVSEDTNAFSSQTEPLANLSETKEPPFIISLNKAVEIAIKNSREYQTEKENLYLAALALTLERNNYRPTFTSILSGRYNKTDDGEFYSGTADFGVSQILATGASLTADFSLNLLRFTTGDPRTSAISVLTGEFIQPLWRHNWKTVLESLTQAERNVIYAIRSFSRYHRTFAVSIATSYYQLLRQRSVVQNEYESYRRLVESRQQAEKLEEAGRLPPVEVDRTRQDELTARDRWISAVEDYRTSLDNFKLDLGLRTDANVDADEEELETLTSTGIIHPQISVEKAQEQALALRLDLMNQRDAEADAERKVEVAANGLGPDVNLVATAAVPSERNNRPASLQFNHGNYSAGLDIGLPLSRTPDRNAYRLSLISLDRARRDLIQLEDQIKLQVRGEWRRLQERRESYEIQLASVSLAQRRVSGENMLFEAGRASARDVLDSQASLRDAHNALISALVDHTIARLELWRDVETLYVTSDGALEEKAHDAKSQTPTQ